MAEKYIVSAADAGYVNLSNGDIRWSNEPNGQPSDVGYYPDEDAAVLMDDGGIHIYDATTGGEIRSGKPSGASDARACAVAEDNGDILYTGEFEDVALVDFYDLSNKWQKDSVLASDALYADIEGDYVALTSYNSWAVIQRSDGSEIASGSGYGASISLDAENDVAYITNHDSGELIKYDLIDKTADYAVTVTTELKGLDVHYSNGYVLMWGRNFSPDTAYYALYDASDGTEIWSYLLGGSDYGMYEGLVGPQEFVLIGEFDNDVQYFIGDNSDGDLDVSYPAGGIAPIAGGENFYKIFLSGAITKSSDGTAISDATVTIESTGDSTSADASGNYTIGSESGSITLVASATDYQEQEKTLDVPSNTTANFELDAKPATISGTVTDANGDPVEGEEIIDDIGNGAVTDSNGNYSLKTAPNATVKVTNETAISVQEIDTGANSEHPGTDFQYGGVSVTVNGPSGGALSDVPISFGDLDTSSTSSGGVASYFKVPPREIGIFAQGTSTGKTATPSPGSTLSITVDVGKLLRLKVKDAQTREAVKGIDIVNAEEGGSSQTGSNGNAKAIGIDGSVPLNVVVSKSDRRYEEALIQAELSQGEEKTEELLLFPRENIGTMG